jgi:ABC-type transport system involved in multi-copper enzyme maturation permease subunit
VNGIQRTWAVAENTLREAVRDKLLYNLLLFAALMIASSIVLAKLHIGYDERIYRDVGLGAIALFGALIAVFVGVSLVHREIALATIYSMLAKPVRRHEFLLGKYLGLCVLLAIEVALMSGFFFGVLWIKGSAITAGMLWAIALCFLELSLITAVALFFSSFTTPYLAGMFTVALWIIGHLLADVRAFGQQDGAEAFRTLTEALYWALPNLDRLDLRAEAASGRAIEAARVGFASLYAASYAAALLVAGVLLFRRRDFR